MKAIILSQTGGIENLTLTELDKPVLGNNEVLVQVKSLSINPVDIKSRTGTGVYGRIKNESPLIIGWDISGKVVESGEGVTKFKSGDEVFGMVNFPGHGKAYAEFVAVPASHLAIKPLNITYQEAAAATLAALTAWQVLIQQANIQAGQRVFIQAAAGGVGHYAVQIAKHVGAHVIGTSSAENADFLKVLGLDEHIDYKKAEFEESVKDVDVFLDSVGAESVEKAMRVMKKGGKIVSIVGGCNQENIAKAEESGITAINYLVQSSGEDMENLAGLLANGTLKSYVSHQYAFENLGEAHTQIETGKTRGKVVVNIT